MVRKEFPGLIGFSLQSVENFIFEISCKTLKANQPLDNFVELFENLKIHLNDEVPWCLHDQIAQRILIAAEHFHKHFSSGVDVRYIYLHENTTSYQLFYKGIAILRIIVTIIPYLKVTEVRLGDWSEPIHSLLLQLLDKMKRIKTLDLRCCVKSKEPLPVMKKISQSLTLLVNLTSLYLDFICTDDILAALSENCKSIQRIFISLSKKVTDDSSTHLMEFLELREVELNGTSVTSYGYHKLLTKTKSKNLLSIGLCTMMPQILHLMTKEPFRTYQLRRLQCFDANADDLVSICKYFPSLKKFELHFREIINEPDLSCLSNLKNLSQLKIWRTHDYHRTTTMYLRNPVENLLIFSKSSIASLSLGYIVDLRATDMFNIAAHCPNILELEFYRCIVNNDYDYPVNEPKPPKPFQKLRKFHWLLNSSLSHAKFVLLYAVNVEELEIRPLRFSIDALFRQVLNFNNMEKLKKLKVDHDNNMSAAMLEHLVCSCKNLSFIGNFMYSKTICKLWLKGMKRRALRVLNVTVEC